MNYEAVKYLGQFIPLMLLLVPPGAGAMIGYQAFKKSLIIESGDIDKYNRRIINIIKGAIVIESMGGLIEILKTFYM